MPLLANIKNFIDRRIEEHPHLEPWLGGWSGDHETQILVDTSQLVERDGKWFTDDSFDGYEVANIRIPYGANTNTPSFYDRQQVGPVHDYWQYIGTTGWNWRDKKSMWVGFDYDAIEGHARDVGVDPDQLEEIKNRALSLDYVVARSSTRGKGVHLIVPLTPQVTTRNHDEHKQLSKHVLGVMSRDCDFDFSAAVDCYGSVLWHWKRGMTNDGLRRIEGSGMGTGSSRSDGAFV